VQTTLSARGRRPRSLVVVAILVAVTLGLLSLPLIPSPAEAATATFKQVAANEIKAGKVNSQAFNKANTVGNLIVVYVVWTNTKSVKVTDALHNKYEPVETRKPWASGRSSQVFYATNIAAGSNTVHATFDEGIKSGWADMYIHEYSGIAKTDPVDISASDAGTSAAMSSGSAETKSANDLIFGAGASSGSVNQVGAGFSSRSTRFGNQTEDKNAGTAGPYDASASQSGANNPWVMHMVAFKVDPNAPDTKPPTKPTGLSQEPISTSQIDLTWKASTDNVGVVRYQVFRNDTPIATAMDTTYSDKNLAPLTTYGYEVRAVDAAGNESPKSTVVNGTTVADTIPPSVSLTAPTSGALPSGPIDLTATASDDVGVVGVQFLLDGNNLGAEDTTLPYAFSWNTSAISGAHVLTAKARDGANHSTISAPVNVTIPAPDTSRPTIAITSPANNAPVNDIVNITADATDNVGVVGVQFLVDGVNFGQEDTVGPYVLPWDSRAVLNGPHTVTAKARDLAGNSMLSAPITINVANNTAQCSVTAGSAPTAIIRSLNEGQLFTAGQVITLNGGVDPDCGALPDSAFSWKIELVKDGGKSSTQVNTIPGKKNASFAVPTTGTEFQGDTQYRITLSATDGESKSTNVVNISPQTVKLTFNTAPAGLGLNVDGTEKPTPLVVDALAGSRHSVDARNQTSGGSSYAFASWSDGKAQQHDIVVPSADQSYTATYTMAASQRLQPGPITLQQKNYSMPRTGQSTVSATYTDPQTAGNTNLVAIGFRSAQETTLEVTDSAGNTYTPAAQLTDAQRNLSQAIYYAKNIKVAPAGNTVKVSFNGARPGPDVRIIEYAGLDPNNPVDIPPSSNSGSNNIATSGPLTTKASNTLLVTFGISWGDFGKAENGFTTQLTTKLKMGGLSGTGIVADRIVKTVDSYTATAPVNGGWLMQLVALSGAS
jgi:Bacterial Ig domain/Fibronectin type III domain